MFNILQRPLFPIISVTLLLAFYISVDQIVVHCVFKNCEEIKPQETFEFAASHLPLSTLESTFGESVKAEPSADAKNKTIAKTLSDRYSIRYVWAFLSSLFFFLCTLGIVFAALLIRGSVVGTTKWLLWCTAIALIFGGTIFLWPEGYMGIIGALYKPTIFAGDIPMHVVSFFNATGFIASIFLVGAVSAILYSVEERTQASIIRELTEARGQEEQVSDEPPTVEQESRYLASHYRTQMRNLQLILYIGGAMLVLAVLQLKTLSIWHQYFISESNGYVSTLLNSFFSASLLFQGGFYTMMLATIYLPAAFIIRQKILQLIDSGALANTELEENGFSENFWTFLPKLIAILAPVLTGTVIDSVIKNATNLPGS